MSEKHRLSDVAFSNDEDCTAPVWTEVEDAVVQQFNIRPFGAIPDVRHASFKYVQSSKRRDRFDVLAHHQRFKSTVEVVETDEEQAALGPIEADMLRFMTLNYPHLGVLVGGMGGGKSTTIRYLLANHLPEISAVYCDLDPNPKIAIESPEWAARLLTQYLSPAVEKLINPSEEYSKAWTWGMSNNDERPHHAKGVLSHAVTKLRREMEDKWLDEEPANISIRKACHEEIHKDPQEYLTYLAFLIDYFLSVHCKNDRGRFLLVLDNIDPLPPKLQYELLRCAARVQESAECKVLVAMRPMTYSRNLQAANRTADFIEHLGPDAIDLIKCRVQSLVLAADLSAIRVKLKDAEGKEFEVGESEIKNWIKEVLATAARPSGGHSAENGAREFIEGVCNNSLRMALVLAPQLFTSAVVPFAVASDKTSKKDAHPIIRGHELVRAIMTGRRNCFRSSNSPVVDSMFDLGRHASQVSLLCKIRLLKKLDNSSTGTLYVEQLRDHLATFGIPDQAVLEGINSIIAQAKRLAWSDTVVEYESFADAPASKLKISDAGRFYVKKAIFNLEYVQEAHIDAPLPQSAILRGYQSSRFSDRISSLRLFLRHLHDIDRDEVLRALAAHRGHEYSEVYGTELISSAMTSVLAMQVQAIGQSILSGGRVGPKYNSEVENALLAWKDLDNLLLHEDRGISDKLKSFQVDRQ